jgi:hypothetical protein
VDTTFDASQTNLAHLFEMVEQMEHGADIMLFAPEEPTGARLGKLVVVANLPLSEREFSELLSGMIEVYSHNQDVCRKGGGPGAPIPPTSPKSNTGLKPENPTSG